MAPFTGHERSKRKKPTVGVPQRRTQRGLNFLFLSACSLRWNVGSRTLCSHPQPASKGKIAAQLQRSVAIPSPSGVPSRCERRASCLGAGNLGGPQRYDVPRTTGSQVTGGHAGRPVMMSDTMTFIGNCALDGDSDGGIENPSTREYPLGRDRVECIAAPPSWPLGFNSR